MNKNDLVSLESEFNSCLKTNAIRIKEYW